MAMTRSMRMAMATIMTTMIITKRRRMRDIGLEGIEGGRPFPSSPRKEAPFFPTCQVRVSRF